MCVSTVKIFLLRLWLFKGGFNVMDPRLEGSLQMSCAFPVLRSEFSSILDISVKGGDNSWYSLAPPFSMQEDPPGGIKWIKDNFAAVNFKKWLISVIVVPVSLSCFWGGQLQACVFPGYQFFPFLLAKHSASGKAIPVGWGVMVFSCLFTHMNNTYSENHWAVNTCKILKIQKL